MTRKELFALWIRDVIYSFDREHALIFAALFAGTFGLAAFLWIFGFVLKSLGLL